MSTSFRIPGERLQGLARRFTDPDANPDIGSRTFLALLVLACAAAFLLVAFGYWARTL